MKTFRSFLILILLLPALSIRLSAQLSAGGSLTAYVDSLITAIPDATPSDLYQVPNSAHASLWSTIVADILNSDLASAQTDAASIDYDIISFTDTTNSKTYSILRKRNSGANYWGTVIVDPLPLRSRLVIQAPHPLHDANTGNQAIVVFKNTGARAYMLAGTHRCNSTALSSCDGTTSVCGGSNQFRKSDQAHNDDGPFQIATERFKHAVPNLIVVQLHGFVKDPGYPDLILGNGTQSAPAVDWLTRFKQELTLLDGTLQYKLAHVDTQWTTLTGTTNTQGRLINNSPDPCGIAAETPNGRVLHIEQAYTGLRDNATGYAKVASAIGNTFPPDKLIASAATGNWENSATWTGSIIPNDTTHVVISAGHTVIVTTASAAARSLSFADNTAHLALAAGADLSLHGDLTLATESHAAFSSWASGAVITFSGSDDQSLNGWNKDSAAFSTSLMEVVVDKSAGTLSTSGSEMNLTIGTRLEVAEGTFILTAGDDLEGRDLAGAASSPAITVQSGGTFIVQGDSSYIRSGTADTAAVGVLRNHGAVRIYGTDLNTGYNFADVFIEDGGVMEFFTGWASSRLLRTDTLLLKAGSLLSTSTTTNVLTSAGRTVIQPGGTYRVLGSSVNFSSNFTNNGTVEYAAAGPQTVSSRDYKKLKLTSSGIKSLTLATNRSVDTLELAGSASLTLTSASSFDLSVNRSLNLAGGNIVTNNDTLVLGQSGVLLSSLSRSSGAVVGNMKRFIAASTASGVVLPVGTSSVYRPMMLSVTGAPTTAGSVAGSFRASDPGATGLPLNDGGTNIIHAATEGYWYLAPSDALTGGTYTVNAAAEGFSGVSAVSSLRLLSRPSSGSWQLSGTHIVGTGTNVSPVVSRSGITTLQEFGIGSGEDNPLPVELSSFTAVPVPYGAELHWNTAMELNSHGFEVERMEVRRNSDGKAGLWESLAFVPGQGTTSEPHSYTYIDRTAQGTARYRLKQIDRDGRSSASHFVEVEAGVLPEFGLEQNYPNPFNPSTTFRFSIGQTGHVRFVLIDAMGREAAVLVNGWKEPGRYAMDFNGSALASGVYYVRMTSSHRTAVRKVILMK